MSQKDEIFYKYIDELKSSLPQFGEIISALMEIYKVESDFSSKNLIKIIESNVTTDD